MNKLHVSARMKIREGKVEGFKQLAYATFGMMRTLFGSSGRYAYGRDI